MLFDEKALNNLTRTNPDRRVATKLNTCKYVKTYVLSDSHDYLLIVRGTVYHPWLSHDLKRQGVLAEV